MKSISGKDFAKALERHGWSLLRIQGSHHIYGKAGSNVRLSVPIHGNQSIKVGLLRHLMKMADLTETTFNSNSALPCNPRKYPVRVNDVPQSTVGNNNFVRPFSVGSDLLRIKIYQQ